MKLKEKTKGAIILLLCVLLISSAGCAAPGRGNADRGAEGGSLNDSADTDGSQGEDADADRIKVPDFEMTLTDGSSMSFEECRGKKVLLNFWATWCGPCVGEMPAFQKLAEEYAEELVILAVNCSEDQGTVQKFVEKNEYTFPVVLDTDGAIQFMFGGITSIPLTVIIDEEGYIVTASAGAADADTMYKEYKEALGL